MAAGGPGEPRRIAAGDIQGLQIGNANKQYNTYTRQSAPPSRGAQASERKVLFRLPRVVDGFTARDAELAGLADSWPPRGGERPPVLVITGPAGVGKTQVAAEYVLRSAADYDLVAWLRGDDPVTDLAALADHLALTEPEQPPEQRADRAVSALAVWDGSWLLVFDNVEDSHVLARWCPGVGPGRVLATARNRGLVGFGATLDLGVFKSEDATEYLLSMTGRPHSERSAAEALAAALGHLPLALAHAAAYCRPGAGGIGFVDYLEQLHELPAAHVFERSPELAYEQTVASTWAASIRAATKDDDLARAVLEIAAMLGPEQIPLPIFDVLLPDGDAPRRALDRKRLRDALRSLHTFSLADVSEGNLVVHRLLQKVVHDHIEAKGDSAPLLRAIWGLRYALPSDVSRPDAWPRCQELASHVARLTDLRDQVLAEEDAAAFYFVLQTMHAYLENSGQPVKALVVAERGLEWTTAIFGPDSERAITSRNNLTATYRSLGRVAEAIAMQERVLADSERLLDRDNEMTLVAMNNLAFYYESAGRVDEAIAIQERVLIECERRLGPDDRNTAAARANLAGFYWVNGRGEEALRLLETAVADSVRLLGPTHPDSLQRRGHLAGFLTSAGRAEEALPLHESVLAELETQVGLDHPLTRNARGLLVETYDALGRGPEAIALQQRVVADSTRVLGPDDRNTLASQSNLARLYWLSDQSEALAVQRRLVEAYERLFGRLDSATIAAQGSLARYYSEAGQHTDAVRLQEDVVQALENVSGIDDQSTVTARNALAGYYWRAGREADAVHLQVGVVADRRRILGPDHKDTLLAAANLMTLYEATGEHSRAAALREAVRADLVAQGHHVVRKDVDEG